MDAGSGSAVTDTGRGPRTRALVLATVGFMLNFWAWALLSPLGSTFVEKGLTADSALLVAVPVLVGSLGRIPVGALTDRYGGRVMMPLISVVSIVPVLFLGFFGQDSYTALLVGGFFLGIAGTVFAVGVPFVNAWFPPSGRGLALGIYGAGMVGTAISAFTTVPLHVGAGETVPFLVAAAVLALYAALAWFLMRDAPAWTPSRTSMVAKVRGAAGLALTWQAMYLYAIAFGGYVAFSVYLPTYLQNEYGLEAGDAAARMGGFVVLAVACRVVGGLLADRIGAVTTLLASYLTVTAMAVVLSINPSLSGIGTAAFLVMAVGLGLGTGAVFGLVGQASDPSKVGAITGLVGAAGGLGGFVPPLILGQLWINQSNYGLGLLALAVASAGAVVITLMVGRAARRRTAADHEVPIHDADHHDHGRTS
ncbi:MFS transporter [Georgenia sp. Z1491]|uniref:MFS transporter n=1 Tax=Georgenia sp. Z1491 TaxID=3416707 RepID=UPI003CF89034